MSWTEPKSQDITGSTHPGHTAHSRISGCGEPRHSASADWQVELYQNAVNFVLGGLSGAFGAAIVYPIDLGMLSLDKYAVARG
jgi:hypothetical protein